MQLDRKIEIVEQATRSIAAHDDAPLDEVLAALDQVAGIIAQQRADVLVRREP